MNLQNKIINVLGDSITQGHGTTGSEHFYQNVLGRMVGAKEVRNFGIGGTRLAKQIGPDIFAAPFTERYLDMPDDADLVLVFGGTNDYGHGNAPFGGMADATADTFCGACHVLFRGLIEKYPTAKIVIMTPLQRTGGTCPCGNTGKPLLDYVDAIIAIAATYSLPVIDLYRTAGIAADVPAQQQLYMPDGLHPNNEGAYRVAERLAGFLSAL